MSLYSMPADGSRIAERQTTAEEGMSHWPGSWSRDDETLLFNVRKTARVSAGRSGRCHVQPERQRVSMTRLTPPILVQSSRRVASGSPLQQDLTRRLPTSISSRSHRPALRIRYRRTEGFGRCGKRRSGACLLGACQAGVPPDGGPGPVSAHADVWEGAGPAPCPRPKRT